MIITSPLLQAADAQPGRDALLTDFTAGSADLGWYVVNDNVMGGRSTGSFDIERGSLRFAGRTNTDGGGFSSIRTGSLQLDLSSYDGLRLRVKGDGRRYTWRLTTGARWRGLEVGYWADFETTAGEWLDVDIPLSDFNPRVRGYQLAGPDLDVGQITGMGLMIYDNQDGPFELQLDKVSVYAASEAFSLSQLRWKRRVVVLSAADGSDKHLKRQLDELAAATAEADERDLAVVTLLDKGSSLVDDRVLAPGQVAALRRSLGIEAGAFALKLVGKDGSVKMSRGAYTPMEEIFALIDTMPMRIMESAKKRSAQNNYH